jgi:hypothetical protein
MKRAGYILAAVGLALALFAPRAEAAAKQMQITFGGYTNRSEVLTNFPVLVVLSNNVGQNFTFADFVTTNGTDLRFATNSASTDWLNYEIESWNTNAGQASYVWVQVPTIPTNGQGAIWANWGDAAASNRLPCTTNGAVWTNGYVGVWHLPDASNSTARDSTSNRYDGTVTSVTATNAMVDGAGGFNGTSSKIVIGDKDVFSSNVLTLESWIKPNSGSLGTAIKGILTKRPTDEYILWLNGGKAEVRVYPGPNTLTGNTGLSAGQLYHVVGVISASSISIYLNGTSDGGPLTRTSTIPNTTDPVVIGWDNYNTSRYFDGVIDEVRVSTVARSSNWVWACWLNQASNAFFNGYGTVQTVTSGGGPTVSAQSASPIGAQNATLNGTVVTTGGAENPQVSICWDTVDKGTNALTDWPNRPYLGTNWGAGQAFSTNVTGLLSGSTYVYRCYATNSTGYAWSGTQSFTTVAMPSVTNLGPVARQTRAQLNGQVLDTGGETPTCWFAWWQDGSGTTNTTPMGTQTGVFTTQLSGLAPGTTYGYLVAASNGAGTVTSETRNFTMFPSGPMAWYAATNGTDGAWTNWTTAGTNLQAILDNAVSNDTIYIAGHTFGLTSQLVWTVSYVPLRGGYAATNAADHPGPNNPALWPTVIQRASGNTRILHVNGVTNGTLDQVTLTGGNMGNGAGIRIDNSVNILIANCTITNNTYIVDDWAPSGGGLYAEAGTSVTISNCMIRGNQIDSSKTHGGAASCGGGIYSAGILTVRDSVIVNNQSKATGWGSSSGGAIYFSGTRLDLRNVLLAGNDSKNTGDGLQVNGGAVSLTNVTVAGNSGEGVRRAGGTVTVKDSILWGNGVDSTGGVTLAWSCYSNSMDHVNGGNNISTNPLFVDTTYYHLKSRGGNYVGGYFSGGTWANASESSPCIDVGDPTSDYSREPEPNGRQVNLGAYGNTPVASKKLSVGSVFTFR